MGRLLRRVADIKNIALIRELRPEPFDELEQFGPLRSVEVAPGFLHVTAQERRQRRLLLPSRHSLRS